MMNDLVKVDKREENPLLKNSYIELFNFAETKKNIDIFMDQIEEWKYMCINILPPKITQNYDIKYEKFISNVSDKVGNYVQQKLDLEQKVIETYDKLAQILSRLNYSELDYFNMSYYHRLSDEIIANRLNVGESYIAHIKRSCIIKIALGLNKAVKTTNK